MNVYLSFNDVDWESRGEDDPSPDSVDGYEGPIPRAGEAVHSGNRWWRVLHVAYTSLKRPTVLTEGRACWIDVTVRIIPEGEDPRTLPPTDLYEMPLDFWQVAYALGRALRDEESQACFWSVVTELSKPYPNYGWHNVMTDGPTRVPYEETL